MTCTCPSLLGDQRPRQKILKPHLYKVGPSWYCKQKNQHWTRLGPRAGTPPQAYAKFRSLYHA